MKSFFLYDTSSRFFLGGGFLLTGSSLFDYARFCMLREIYREWNRMTHSERPLNAGRAKKRRNHTASSQSFPLFFLGTFFFLSSNNSCQTVETFPQWNGVNRVEQPTFPSAKDFFHILYDPLSSASLSLVQYCTYLLRPSSRVSYQEMWYMLQKALGAEAKKVSRWSKYYSRFNGSRVLNSIKRGVGLTKSPFFAVKYFFFFYKLWSVRRPIKKCLFYSGTWFERIEHLFG